ncbi:Duo1 subunit of the Dam1 (DASH) complex [Candida orthopsilosis Co 90-125]|uniref:DASH complex subunit DUO1 n=1 Tax=Candida orthopsilosis (strain 90-125) TaxID=1136231 RepID=H8X7L7_CANO9|nr:Duo1 subunit of the Dam1 (DASH) complex [Candida orthopsilosis Co 90-125]CCG23802.1 Duo1 subunit of the Dam1 (DASH) complex [Candida orthopsilosis Co 90-125]
MSSSTPKASSSSKQPQPHRPQINQNQFRQTNDPLTPREIALTKELKQLRLINTKFKSMVTAVDSVKSSMAEFNNGTTNALIMMNKWSDIISQASFTHEMLNNPEWHPQEDVEDEDNDDDEGDYESQDTINFQAMDKNDDAELELLSRQLINYESENLALNKRLEKEIMTKQEKRNSVEEQANKRRRELGLFDGSSSSVKRRPVR